MTNMAKKINGYEQIYLELVKSLAGFDFSGNAPHLGLKLNPEGQVKVRFLGRDYLVDSQGAHPLDGRAAEVNHLSLVVHYAVSPGRGEPSGQFLPLRRMTGMVEGQGTFENDGVSRPLLRKFEGDLPALEAAVARLGGDYAGPDESGGLSWVFRPFPKVPLKLVHHLADEEFPADFRLLFDSSATAFMEFEALGFLAGVFVNDLCQTSEP